ncbi:lytic transglycosylase domain-containing protein [Oligoflexia bacterium]|nr:lytic transglycosylase domain-containing protein [Oligoflexia bacterium]
MKESQSAAEISEGFGVEQPRSESQANPAVALFRPQRQQEPQLQIAKEKQNELLALSRWLIKVVVTTIKAPIQVIDFLVRSIWSYVKYHPGHTVFHGLLSGILITLIVTGSGFHQEHIDGKLSARTVSTLIEASQYTRAYELVGLQNKGLRELLAPGAPSWMQKEAVKAILAAATEAGLSIEHKAVLLATVEVESGFNPMARATTTTACGLFQFVRITGQTFGLTKADCLNPWLNAQAGVKHYIKNYKEQIDSRIADLGGSEKVLRMFELSYYLHHDGTLATEASDSVKATVLSGGTFLFKALEILQKEIASKQKQQSFIEKIIEELGSIPRILRDIRDNQTAMR